MKPFIGSCHTFVKLVRVSARSGSGTIVPVHPVPKRFMHANAWVSQTSVCQHTFTSFVRQHGSVVYPCLSVSQKRGNLPLIIQCPKPTQIQHRAEKNRFH